MSMSLKILYKLTTRSRPEWCKRAIKSILDNEVDDNRLILVSLDSDDPTMTTPEIMEWLSENGCHICYGRSKNKIDAINRDVDKVSEFYDWDILVNVSDDQVFIDKGFDNIIRDEITIDIPQNEMFSLKSTNQVLHFPDGNRSDLMTMSIIGRHYYERDGYIYHPTYISVYCDDEAQEVAKQRGCYKFVDKNIFQHLHPAYGTAIFDEQYAKNESYYVADKANFELRKHNGFPA